MATFSTRDSILETEDYVDPKNVEKDSLKIIARAKPHWKEDQVKFKPCPGAGFMNTMLICQCGDDSSDVLVIRVFGEGLDYLMNKRQEVAATKLFHEIGVSPTVYCIFKNGICMEFVQGVSYEWADISGMRDLKVVKAVARELAKVHCHKTGEIALKKYGYAFRKDETETERKAKEFIDNWPAAIADPMANEMFQANFPSFDVLKTETARMLGVLAEMSHSIQICHSDANPTNVIYIPEQDRAVLIDYDFSGFNYRILDLATFIEFSAIGLTPDVEGTKRFSDDFIKDFLREYLKTKHTLGEFEHEPSNHDVEMLFILTMKGILAFYHFYSMALIFLACERERHGLSKKDIVGIACTMNAWYWQNRDAILAVETPHPWQKTTD